MCGIAGIWYRDGRPVDTDTLVDMAASLAHRGRDGEGVWTSGDLGLAHKRLSIIDLSESGRQPMASSDGRYHISFNGEIHNYLELRDELIAAGWTFRTQTDTEVIVSAYQQWGPDCFSRFNGMWALALWDERTRELVLSRDRFGIKPLFYSIRGSRLAFASEAKAILAAFPEEATPDHWQINSYLRSGSTDVGERTFFAAIRQFPAATYMRITNTTCEAQRYWSYQSGTEVPCTEVVETFRDLVIDAVRLRLRSDAPLGVWVSGGLDSSTVVRVAQGLLDKPVHCYSLRYEGWAGDESRYAALVADDPDRFVQHWITPDASDLLHVMAKITWHHDAPPASRGRFPMWFVAQESARTDRVILTGDGADELLGGYGAFIWPYLLDRLRRSLPRSSLSSRMGWVREFRTLMQVEPGSPMRMLRRALAPLACRLGYGDARGHALMAPAYDRAYRINDPTQWLAGWLCRADMHPYQSWLNNALWREFTHRGLPEILRGFDAISMAHTLELRAPFMDHRLVEFVFSLPYDDKMSGGWTKVLLRRAFRDMLPREIEQRRHKLGFPSPVYTELRAPRLRPQIEDLLMDGYAVRAGIFCPRRLEKSLRGSTSRLSGEALWRGVCLEHWLRLFINGRGQPEIKAKD